MHATTGAHLRAACRPRGPPQVRYEESRQQLFSASVFATLVIGFSYYMVKMCAPPSWLRRHCCWPPPAVGVFWCKDFDLERSDVECDAYCEG